ncbi:MAG: VWA domain-containing protein [Paludibacteraceae bacterium]|nr:VWA domain-containing protein [Paludibacteraceae bacterium]
MTFANPLWFLMLILIVPVIVWYILKENTFKANLTISSTEAFTKMPKQAVVYLRHLPFILAVLAYTATVFALARPQTSDSWSNKTTEGIDIVMSLDISSSMLAEDLKPNRLEAAKKVAVHFIGERPNDNIGVVLFSGESFTQCPLTTNHAQLINLISGVKSGMIEDGTAIGSGLATAINRLRDSQAKSKVIILLTDGSNNRGEIAPVTAGEIAKTFGIRIYTIGVGKQGMAPYPVQTPYGIQYHDIEVDIDEPTLQQIAQVTGGKYFRATDNKSLEQIYEDIDKLEKSIINVSEFSQKEELFHWFALVAVLCIVAEVVLKNTKLRSIP